MNSTIKTEDRFERDANRYVDYLQSPEGRLRVDLPLANLQDFLPPPLRNNPLRALDLGGGTGAAAVRLARLGIDVTLLDSSPAMLQLAERAIAEAGVRDRVTLQHGDAAQLGTVQTGEFEIVLCHNLLEFVDDPVAVLRGVGQVMRGSSAVLSILVRNQAGEVLKAALQSGNLAAAEHNVTAEWGEESLYGGKVRLFTPELLQAMMKDARLRATALRGVRVIADYLPAQISRADEYDRIFALERKLGQRQEFIGAARYLHCLASRSSSSTREDE